MNKAELIEAIKPLLNDQYKKLTKKEIDAVISAQFEVIQNTVANGEKVTIVGFGSFESKVLAEREGHNPKTGEKMFVPSSTVPKFKAGKIFKEKVAGIE